jgi:hypothetical protein
MNLRKFAQGKPCQVRIPGVCNFDETTTVLAHLRRGGVSGTGCKPHDLVGVHSCSNCHDVIDGRRKTNYPPEEILVMVLDGLCRTLDVVGRAMDD